MKTNYNQGMLESVGNKTHEEITEELYQIRQNLMWLDDEIALTTRQRILYNNVQKKVNKLLGVHKE